MVWYRNWWGDDGNTQDFWFTRFFEQGCKDWGLDHNDICIWSVFGAWPSLLNESKSFKVRIFFTGENLNNMHTHWNRFDIIENYVDIILGFHSESKKFQHFPLWLIYWDFWKNGLFKPVINPDRLNKAVIIANHNANGSRTAICNYVAKQGIKIDCNKQNIFNPVDTLVTLGPTVEDKQRLIQNYRYNICPENSLSIGYTTEKLFQSIAAGCTPIYCGAQPLIEVINPKYIALLNNTDIKLISPVNEYVWLDNALTTIFKVYAMLWSNVFRILNKENKKCIATNKILYKVKDREEAKEKLYKHWKKYNHFFEPRASFEIDEKVVEFESLF